MADITIAGNRINPVVLIIGGAGIILLVLLMRGGGSNTAALSNTGVVAEEFNQALQAQREDATNALAEQKDELEAQLALSEGRLAAAIAKANEKADAAAEGDKAASAATGTLLEALKAQLAALQAAIEGLGKAATGPAKYDGPKPSDQEVRDWAQGIGLPVTWGFRFVDFFGRLPNSIPELESWRPQVGTRNSAGQWCIAGDCI